MRFSNSGTEAVMAALRLARAYTGRDSYVLVEGSYHGLFDAAMWMANMADWEPGQRRPAEVPYSQGIPQTPRRAGAPDADERRATGSRTSSAGTATTSPPC